jgi:hypothetical protein
MQDLITKLVDFVHSIGFVYLLCACWALNVLMMKRENTTLRKRCDSLQAENVKLQKCHNIKSSVSELTEG